MKWVLPLAALALLFLAGVGAFWLLRGEPAAKDVAPARAAAVDPNVANVVSELIKQGGGSAVVVDGKVMTVQFNMPGADNVDISTIVNGKDGHTSATILVTIKDAQPQVLTREGYEKVKDGMTYAQAGEALGGVMSKGRLRDPFSGTLAVVQGKRRIELIFKESKIASKSASGIE
jgi:hypothetical protein